MPQLNIGFIGFGQQAAKQHARYIVQNCSSQIKIVAICDILDTDTPLVREHLEELGLSDVSIHTTSASSVVFDASDIRSIEQLLGEHPELNAMIISTPHAKHYYQIKACLERKLHVLVDKPLALTYKQAKQLVDLSNNVQGPCLVVSSQRRYEDVYLYAKRVIDTGELGALINVDGIISHSLNQLQGWRRDVNRAGGGALLHFGWHVLDTILYLANRKALAVDAALRYSEDWAVETHANALILFEGGLSATVSINAGAPADSVYERLQIWGTKGTLILDRFKPTYDDQPATVTHQMHTGRILGPDLTGAIAKKWAPTEAFVRLITCVAGGTEDCEQAKTSVASTGADSLETVRLIEAIYASASINQRVTLTE
jgi:predicted dehydrogenase